MFNTIPTIPSTSQYILQSRRIYGSVQGMSAHPLNGGLLRTWSLSTPIDHIHYDTTIQQPCISTQENPFGLYPFPLGRYTGDPVLLETRKPPITCSQSLSLRPHPFGHPVRLTRSPLSLHSNELWTLGRKPVLFI